MFRKVLFPFSISLKRVEMVLSFIYIYIYIYIYIHRVRHVEDQINNLCFCLNEEEEEDEDVWDMVVTARSGYEVLGSGIESRPRGFGYGLQGTPISHRFP